MSNPAPAIAILLDLAAAIEAAFAAEPWRRDPGMGYVEIQFAEGYAAQLREAAKLLAPKEEAAQPARPEMRPCPVCGIAVRRGYQTRHWCFGPKNTTTPQPATLPTAQRAEEPTPRKEPDEE